MTISQLLKKGAEMLNSKERSYHDNIVDATLILCHVLKKDKIYLVINKNEEVDFSNEINFFRYVNQRKEHMPIAYITSNCEFMGLDFYVNESVLIPRPDTEILVEKVETLFDAYEKIKILDLCSGSGCIGISLASYYKNAQVTLMDISKEAIEVAKINSKGYSNVEILNSDALELKSIDEFDVIVSNPPYITFSDYENLEPNVKNYEPKLALVAKNDGLLFYETIIKNCRAKYMAFEVGIGQSQIVSSFFSENFQTQIIKDLNGIERVVLAKYVNIC